jgi:ribonucleoside-diphosphate reductase alpha chain
MIPFESLAAKICNKQIIKHIRTEMDKANLELGKKRGEAPDAAGTGFRFSHVMAIAPNATTSIIMGNTSPSIEPYRANAYRQDTLSGSYMNKNKHLEKLLKEKVGDDTQEIWSSIIANNGSVQHLKELTDEEKEVFKTAIEIDQRWVIEHAADRQKFIDQGQSLNLFFKPDESIKYLHTVHFMAWKLGLKTLYYCRSESIRKADKVSQKIERKRIEDIDMNQVANGEGCLACEG